MYFAKTPILVLYIRLFGIKPWVRYTCYLTLAVTLPQFLAITALVGASCTPMARDGGFKSQKAEACMTKIFIVGMWNGIISIVTDVIVFVIPIPIIIQIQLPLKRKTGLGFVFVTGIL